MDLKCFDNQCVRITTVSGEIYEGVVSYCNKEYVFHEYGQDEEALLLVPILLYERDISDIVSLENAEGPYGHFSEKYGLLEMKCLEWGTDLIEEVLESEDDVGILRMLVCLNDNFQSVLERAVSGMAPWRYKGGELSPESGEAAERADANEQQEESDEQGPIYLGELEKMLGSLVKYSGSDKVVKAAESMLARLTEERITK